MVRKDWTKQLIPRRLKNISRLGSGSEFDTVDKVWIDDAESYQEMDSTKDKPTGREIDLWRRNYKMLHKTLGTDFVVLAGASVNPKEGTIGQNYVNVRLRSCTTGMAYETDCAHANGRLDGWDTIGTIPLCPSVYLKADIGEEYDIYVNTNGEHILRIGEYVSFKDNRSISEKLEEMYNGGNLLDELSSTGRWYSSRGKIQDDRCAYNVLKHSPEFEYEGERYVRFVSYADEADPDERKYL